MSDSATVEPPPANRASRTRLLVLALPFVISAIALGVLAVRRIPAEVRVELHSTRLTFTSGAPVSHFLGSPRLKTLRLVNFDRLVIGGGRLERLVGPEAGQPERWTTIGVSGADTLVTATRDLASITLFDVALDRASVTQGAQITLAWSEDDPASVQVRLRGDPLTGAVQAGTGLEFSCNYCAIAASAASNGTEVYESARFRLTSQRPRVLSFAGRSPGATLGLEPDGEFPIEQSIPVHAPVDLTIVDGTQRHSALTGDGATITFAESQRTVAVAPSEILALDDLQSFSVATLAIDHGLRVTMHGVAGKISTGPQGFLRDQRPTMLEWIYAQHAWILYLQTVIMVATTALAVMQRMKLVAAD